MKFSTKNFFSKCDQIRRKLRIWSHLLEKSLMENFIFLFSVSDIYQTLLNICDGAFFSKMFSQKSPVVNVWQGPKHTFKSRYVNSTRQIGQTWQYRTQSNLPVKQLWETRPLDFEIDFNITQSCKKTIIPILGDILLLRQFYQYKNIAVQVKQQPLVHNKISFFISVFLIGVFISYQNNSMVSGTFSYLINLIKIILLPAVY